MQDIESHQRVLNTLTDPIERPVLRWLASRMPSWKTSLASPAKPPIDAPTPVGTIKHARKSLFVMTIEENILYKEDFCNILNNQDHSQQQIYCLYQTL